MTEPTDTPASDDQEPRTDRADDGQTSDGDGDGARRRRRRGGRGGRGRGGRGDAPASREDTTSSDTSGDAGGTPTADDEDDGSPRRRRRGRRGRGRGGRGDGGDASGNAEQDPAPTASLSDPDQAEPDQAEPDQVDPDRSDEAASSPATGSDGGGDPDAAPVDAATGDDASAGRGSSERDAAAEDGPSEGGASDDGANGDGRSSSRSRGDGGRSPRGGGKGRGSSRGGKGGGSSRGAGEDGATEGDGGDPDDATSDEDREVAAAIAKGGTRMAAKGNRGRGGGGGNGGGRGNGGGSGRGRGQRPGGVSEEVRRAILDGPPRTMVVTKGDERTQIGVLEDRTVVEHYVTRKKDVTFVGNIYMARVQNVLPGMEAAFLDIGKGRNGVLYAGEVLYDELDLEEGADQRIENVLKPGQKVLVQVTKDPMGSKGPRLTMHLSLAGRYSVLAPSSELFGISRKLTDRERDRLRRIVKKVKPDEHGVIVRTAAENATEEQLTADLERLLGKWSKVEEAADGAKAMTAVYEEPPLVVKVIRDNFGPEFERCIVDDEDLYHQVRGYLDEVAPELTAKVELYGQPTSDARARAGGAPPADAAAPDTADTATVPAATGAATGPATSEVTSDAGEAASSDAPTTGPDTGDGEGSSDADRDAAATTPAAPDEAAAPADPAEVVGGTAPTTVDLDAARERRATLPALFDAYDVTDQLRKATGRKVWLPSGGYLIIESTEAMKVIDVNSGKFTGSGDMNLEEVVLRTNLEAADEIVRQLRLRDMGGIIVIDFIDMLLKANQDQVVRRLKRELLRDRTKTRVSEVSRLGLVQMTRKNVSQGLVEAFSHTCEACEGRGLISELG